MYAWIWRKLPGALWSKLTMSIVMIAAVGSLLWYVVFPWATPLLPFDDVQVGGDSSQIDPNSVDQDSPVPGGSASADPDTSAPEAIPYSTSSNHPDPGLAGD
jgi:hypothetical protein